MHPRQILETVTPLLPSLPYCIVFSGCGRLFHQTPAARAACQARKARRPTPRAVAVARMPLRQPAKALGGVCARARERGQILLVGEILQMARNGVGVAVAVG